MNGKELFIFYLISWVCGRLYILAGPYIHVKIFHSIGLHFLILCLVGYIIHISTNAYQILFWRLFFLYETIGAITFCYTQLTMDHFQAAKGWTVGTRTSALSRMNFSFGIVQDLFIPAFIAIAAFTIYKFVLNSESS